MSIGKILCSHLQELAVVHSNESLQFLQFSSYVTLTLDLAITSGINHSLVFSVSGQMGCTNRRPHTNVHKTGWDSHLALEGFFSPSFIPPNSAS
jgi:hypothetical protein